MTPVEQRSRPRVRDEPPALRETRIFLQETWAPGAVFLPTLVGIWISPSTPIPLELFSLSTTWQTAVFAVTIVLAFVGGISVYRNRKNLRDEEKRSDALEAALSSAEQRCGLYDEGLTTALERSLHRLADDLALKDRDESGEQSLNNSVRLTVYLHDPQSNVFQGVARIAGNPAFADFRRPAYPAHQGLIGQAWEEGVASARRLEDDRTNWNAEQTLKYGFDSAEASAIRMQSKSYAGLRLEIDDEHVGVLMVESLNKQGIQRETTEKIRSSNWRLPIASLVATFRSAWLHS